MKTIYVNINKVNGKVQYLTSILPSVNENKLPEIPSNTILCKTLTGTGATYSEIKALRNSIIIEPNVPPITGKCSQAKHKSDNMFGVHEGVSVEKIARYILKSVRSKKHIKILTTPESYIKVKHAFESVDMDIYFACFLLFDECHKLVKDVDFRPDIALPIDDFFMFREKAFVSATPIIPKDKRFEEQEFKIIKVCPTFDYKNLINLIPTNNVLETVKRILPTVKSTQNTERSICFFINSTDIIYQCITKLGIEDDSMVFCADKSVDKLKGYGFKHASSKWNPSLMKRYNFFTSRFNAAFDAELEEKPDIIFISEVYFAEYSMVDPNIDAVQAIGRFRNGISSVTHIFNTNNNLPVRNEEGIREYISGSRAAYMTLKNIYDVANSIESRRAYLDALNILPYKKLLGRDGKEDAFSIENYVDEALLKSAYNNVEAVVNKYEDSQFIPQLSSNPNEFYYLFGEYERLKLTNKVSSIKDKRKEIVKQLTNLEGELLSDMLMEYKKDLKAADPFIFDAFETVGKEVIEQNNYSYKKINEAMILKRYREQVNGTTFLSLVYNSFQVGKKYPNEFIKAELTRLYEQVDISPMKHITAQSIKRFFKKDNTFIYKKGKSIRAMLLKERKI